MAAIYYDASARIYEAKKAIEKGQIPLATTKIQEIYKVAETMIQLQYVEGKGYQGNPGCVMVELVNLISLDVIQYENSLKYEIAKACRIFMDLTFLAAISTGQNTYTQSHKTILESLGKVQDTLPKEEVATDYELRCCWATALVLNDEMIYVKQFIAENIGDVIKAVATLSPGELSKPLLQSLKDVWHLIDTSWFTTVFPLHLQSRVVILRAPQPSAVLEDFYKTNSEFIKDGNYTKANKIAFCVLESLITIFNKLQEPSDAGSGNTQLAILEGKDEKTIPGIQHFARLGLSSTFGTKKESWKVRFKAISFLFEISCKAQTQKVWEKSLEIIAHKFEHQENKHVCQLIARQLKKIKQSNPKRVAYLKTQISTKTIDKAKLGSDVAQIYKDLEKTNVAIVNKTNMLKLLQEQQKKQQEEVSGSQETVSSEKTQDEIENLKKQKMKEEKAHENLQMKLTFAEL